MLFTYLYRQDFLSVSYEEKKKILLQSDSLMTYFRQTTQILVLPMAFCNCNFVIVINRQLANFSSFYLRWVWLIKLLEYTYAGNYKNR